MNNRDRIILLKIIDEASALAQMLDGVDESAFLANDEKMRAVCMTLINIGELVKNITVESRQEYRQIPWKDMAGLHDVTAHGYFTLRMSDIWIFAAQELPMYAAQIRAIVN
ncbi:MAG: DUF86 domain-containing protein [Clostridiales bacterium]|jgi:uncharacterized protein with HEPN domain|nr:DUF86 domain-containing protein [Clostridiales bacterium]